MYLTFLSNLKDAVGSKQLNHGHRSNPRRMRRIIVEDPGWNLNPVPLLTELCVSHILKNFQENPILDSVPEKYRTKVLEGLTDELPLSLTIALIHDDDYWKRCAQKRFTNCTVSDHGHSWKRLYFERYTAGKKLTVCRSGDSNPLCP